MDAKYIFLDIDGTLVGRNARIPDSARRAVEEARKNGHKVFICSGRSRCEMHDELLNIEVDGIVGSAGAYVELDGEMIYHRPMTEEMNAKLFDYFERNKMAIMVETNDELYLNKKAMKWTKRFSLYCKLTGKPYDKGLFDLSQPIEDVKEPAKLPINKILYIMCKKKIDEVRADLQDYTIVDCAIKLNGSSGEISEYGMHKGNGINIVAERFGIDIKDTVGVGDGENDFEMLKVAGISIAMGNANEALKEIADYVTTDVDEDGIYNAFKHYGLI